MSYLDYYGEQNRSSITLAPDLRELRLALGFDLSTAAALLQEPPSLLQAQEAAGLDVDPTFRQSSLDRYLETAIQAIVDQNFPLAVDEKQVTSVRHMRQGLGLSLGHAALVLRSPSTVIAEHEDARRAISTLIRNQNWRSYVEMGTGQER